MHPGYTIDEAFLKDLRAMRRDWLLGGRAPGGQQTLRTPPPRKLHFKNTFGGEAPSFAVMKVDDVDETYYDFFQVQRPTGSGTAFLINGPAAVATQQYGVAFREGRALYEPSDGTPAVGEIWGPTSGAWTLRKNQPGFEIRGGVDATTQTVYVWPQEQRIYTVQVWGTSGASPGDLITGDYVSGRIRSFVDPGTGFSTGGNCWIYGANFLNTTVQTVPLAEGMLLVGNYVGQHNPSSAGLRPTFVARNPLHLDSEIGMLLTTPWTVTSDAGAIIPFDFGWPTGWADNRAQPVYADYSPGEHKLQLRYGSWGYSVGFRVVLRLPATIAGTQFAAADNTFRFHPVTVVPTMFGAPLFWHDCRQTFIVPPANITGTDSGGDTFTVPLAITGGYESQYLLFSGHLTVDAALWGLADGSYLQLTIDNAQDAVIEFAELWAHSNVFPSM